MADVADADSDCSDDNWIAVSTASDPCWTVKCDICKKPVGYFCNTCEERLCSFCREYHLKSRASSDHDVVLFSDNAESLIKSLSFCKVHKSQKYQLWCEPCKKPVCVKCITQNHNTHKFIELKAIHEMKKKELASALHNLRNDVLPKWEKQRVEIGNSIRDYKRNIQSQDKELIQEGEKMKSRIDGIVDERRKQLEQNCSLVVKDLENKEDNCRKENLKMKQIMDEFEDLRHKDQMRAIYFDISRTNYVRLANIPEVSQPDLPRLIEKDLHIEDLQERFGVLNISTRDPCKETIQRKETTVQRESYLKMAFPTQVVRRTQQAIDDPHLLQEHILVHKVKTTASSPSVGCLPSQRTWMETQPNFTSMVNVQGQILHSVEMPPSSFTVSSKEHIVAISYDEKCVTEISKANERRVLFTLPFRPTGICFSPEGHIVIAFHEAHQTAIYDRNARAITEYTSVRCPYKVTVNKVTHDICISSKADLSVPGCIERISALSKSGDTHYEYKGPDPDHFSPEELCSDPSGRVLVADCGSSQIHIISPKGEFLGYVWIQLEKFHIPMTIDCDREVHVWVGEMNGTIKVVKYALM